MACRHDRDKSRFLTVAKRSLFNIVTAKLESGWHVDPHRDGWVYRLHHTDKCVRAGPGWVVQAGSGRCCGQDCSAEACRGRRRFVLHGAALRAFRSTCTGRRTGARRAHRLGGEVRCRPRPFGREERKSFRLDRTVGKGCVRADAAHAGHRQTVRRRPVRSRRQCSRRRPNSCAY